MLAPELYVCVGVLEEGAVGWGGGANYQMRRSAREMEAGNVCVNENDDDKTMWACIYDSMCSWIRLAAKYG